jgi:hypothetical protein
MVEAEEAGRVATSEGFVGRPAMLVMEAPYGGRGFGIVSGVNGGINR